MNINIWVSYHSNEIYDKYKLNELDTSIYKSFNTSEHYPLLHSYFNEFITMYHVYKNDIKSDIVGFCHYRRYFDLSTIDFNDVYDNDKIICKMGWDYLLDHNKQEWPLCRTLSKIVYNTYLQYFKTHNIKLKYEYDYYLSNPIDIAGSGMFICRYDTFYNMMNDFFNYFNEIFPNWENDHNIICNVFDVNKNELNWRMPSYAFEQLIGFLLRNYNDHIVEFNNINHIYAYKLKTGEFDEIEHIKQLYYIYLKNGINCFYIIQNNINVNDWHTLNHKYMFEYINIINNENEIETNNYIMLS